MDFIARAEQGLGAHFGGPQRARLVLLLAAALALDSLDRGSLGAMAPSLEASLHFSNTGLGVLLAVVSASSAVATLGAGVLTDRWCRTRLMAWSLSFWVVAMASGALAESFTFLLVSRVALGTVIATVGPASASLVGDLYPSDERGRVMGWIRSGEFVGIGIAFMIVSAVTLVLSWRAVFVVLAVAGGVVAWQMWNVQEPSRTSESAPGDNAPGVIDRLIDEEDIEPGPESVVVRRDGREMSLAQVARYALDVPTNRMLLAAEAVGDFALSGVAAFAVLFATQQYGISQSMASAVLPVAGAGAVAGILAGGRLGDWLIEARRLLAGRLWVAGLGYLAAVAFVPPVLFVHSMFVALPFLMVAGAGLGASIPTISAARLDVVVASLWGRVESVRTVLRTVAVVAAPLVGGYLSDHLLGGGLDGLRLTIVLVLPLLAGNGVLVLVATRSYPSDVAAANESRTGRSPSDA